MTIHHGVTSTLLSHVVPLTVEALSQCAISLSIPEEQNMSLLRYPPDGTFIEGEIMSWQVTLQGGNRMQIAGCQIRTAWGMV